MFKGFPLSITHFYVTSIVLCKDNTVTNQKILPSHLFLVEKSVYNTIIFNLHNIFRNKNAKDDKVINYGSICCR